MTTVVLTKNAVARSFRALRHQFAAAALSVALAAVGCDRSEGTRAANTAGAATAMTAGATAVAGASSAPPPAASPGVPTPAQPVAPVLGLAGNGVGGASGAAPCLVPTPAEAPPPAEPASICPAEPEPGPVLPLARVTFPEVAGAPGVEVEVAQRPSELSRGLMYRTAMPPDRGMLFRWDDERIRSFWMRNTCIPLDMLFLSSSGMVVGIHEQVPVLNERARSILCPAAYVLEVNAGWCRKHGVRAGVRAVIEDVR